jgi:glutamate-1-semialdehyde aminotransferase
VILEPVIFELPRHNFLHDLSRLCRDRGTLLIFDEMWTGFRLAVGGAQEHFDVTADLACFSKAIANGMPLSVLSGRAEVMRLLDEQVFFYTTFGGEALSLAAARATVQKLKSDYVPQYLALQGAELKNGYNRIAAGLSPPFTRCVGLDCRSLVTFDEQVVEPLLAKSLLQQELLRHGVLWTGFHNMSRAHSREDVAHVLGAYERALPVLADAIQRGQVQQLLRGRPVQPVFRKTL